MKLTREELEAQIAELQRQLNEMPAEMPTTNVWVYWRASGAIEVSYYPLPEGDEWSHIAKCELVEVERLK